MTTDKTIKSKNQPKQTNVTWVDLSGETPVEKHFINGRWKSMGGGVSDYSDIKNKPTINGVELDGNKTSQDLGVYSKPSSGIPQSDLSSDVQSQLNKHFKGWYASSSALPSTPVVGDYAYVKGAETTDPAAIYECTTNGTWSDSGKTVDTSNMQTFADGQKVNEVHIVNNLITGGTEDVLSAEQGKVIVDRFSLIQPTEQTINLKSDVVWLEGFYSIDEDGSLHERTATFKTSDYINLPSNAKTINYYGGTATTDYAKEVAIYNDNNECLGTFFQYPAANGVSFDISNLVGATKMRISEYDVRINNNTWNISVGIEVIHTNQEVFEDFTQSVDDRFDEVDEQFENLDNNYYLADPVDVETNLKDNVVWLEGYYYIAANGTLTTASSVGKVSDYIDLLPNTKAIRYKGGIDINENNKQVAIYNSEGVGLATFRIRPVPAEGNVFDITEYPTAVKMRICEWEQYIANNSWDISVIHPVTQTNKETFDNFVDLIDSLNQWKGKRFIGFGASTTSAGFSDNTSYLQIAADKLKMLPPLSGFASRRVSLKYVDDTLNLVGLAATIAECESISQSTTISYETQFAKDFDCVLFGTFAGESYVESEVVIDGTTYYGGEELLDLVKLPTTRYNNNPHFTYSDGSTLAEHRDSYIGAVIYLLNELWTRKPTCRVVFTYSFLQWNDYSVWDRNRNGIKKLCEKLHLPFLDLAECVYFNGFTTGTGAEEDKTNPNIFLYDGQHPSLAGRQRLGNIFTHKLLLVS